MYAYIYMYIFCSHGLRLIPESEIGHAVLNISINRYCNPEIVIGTCI